MGDNPADWAKYGYGGLLIVPFIVYKVYQMLKDDKRGDNNNSRIDTFYANLQTQLERMGVTLDNLRKEKDQLVLSNATFAAKLEIAQEEVKGMQMIIDRHVDRIKYLQALLDKANINYV